MKLVLALMSHETNTFSPVATPWERFVDRSCGFSGEQAVARYRGTNSGLGAYLELAESAGAQFVVPIAASAPPSGPVQATAYEYMCDAIVAAVRDGCDGVMLDLHGAMVTETTPDGEGTLLQQIRSIAPGIPICVTYDLHANVTGEMVANCDAMIGYKTYPHVDMGVVGRQVGRILLDQLAGRLSPVIGWGNRPLLAQTLCMGHEDEPMGLLQEMTRDIEREGALAATVFGGFPLADVAFAGLSSVVVTDGDRTSAQAGADRLLDAAWRHRDEFVFKGEPLSDAVARAKRLDDGPIVLLDHADNCASGGTQDVMTVIAEVARQGLEDVVVACVYDPEAVAEMMRVGVGAQVSLRLGGKMDMPSIGLRGEPLPVEGRVRLISEGTFTVRGPMMTGLTMHMGTTAVLDLGPMELIVVSKHVEPWDLGVFTSLGIDPSTKRYLLLKSRIHWRAAFGSIARHTIACDGKGVTSSDNALFAFRNVRRPIHPLDRINEP